MPYVPINRFSLSIFTFLEAFINPLLVSVEPAAVLGFIGWRRWSLQTPACRNTTKSSCAAAAAAAAAPRWTRSILLFYQLMPSPPRPEHTPASMSFFQSKFCFRQEQCWGHFIFNVENILYSIRLREPVNSEGYLVVFTFSSTCTCNSIGRHRHRLFSNRWEKEETFLNVSFLLLYWYWHHYDV